MTGDEQAERPDEPALTPAEAEELVGAVPLSGSLREGREVRIGWPEPHEFDKITTLRNDPHTRKWFLDTRPLHLGANRRWLAAGMRRPYESVLAVRWKRNGLFLGSIGWMDWEPHKRSLAIGRLMVDREVVRGILPELPRDYEGVARDASLTLGHFVVETMGVWYISFCYLQANARVRPSVELGELQLEVLEELVEQAPDGRALVRLRTQVPRSWRRGAPL